MRFQALLLLQLPLLAAAAKPELQISFDETKEGRTGIEVIEEEVVGESYMEAKVSKPRAKSDELEGSDTAEVSERDLGLGVSPANMHGFVNRGLLMEDLGSDLEKRQSGCGTGQWYCSSKC